MLSDWIAAVASGIPTAAWGERADLVTVCFSKGLGCPLGAVLAGSRERIEEAWEGKFLFGGAMRQAGMVAAAALYALEHNVDRLADDHRRARRLAEGTSVTVTAVTWLAATSMSRTTTVARPARVAWRA